MNAPLSDQMEKLSAQFSKINVVDSSPDNTIRAINLLEKAFCVVEECTSQTEFSRTQRYLRDNDPGLDIQAIRQLFKEANGILGKENNTADRRVVLETLVKRLDTLSGRLDSAQNVYSQLPAIVKDEFEGVIMTTGIKAGLIAPTGEILEENADEVMKKMNELMAPTKALVQGINAAAVMMKATLLVLSTAVVPMKMKADSTLEKLSEQCGPPDQRAL